MKSYYERKIKMSEIIQDKVNQINCLNEEIDSLYHQAALKLGVSDCVLFVLYMLHTNDGKCLLYDIYKLSRISKQTVNSAIRKLENRRWYILLKKEKHILPRQLHDYLRLNVKR